MDSFPVRRPTLEPQLLSALASLLGLAPPAKDLAIRGVATLADAGPQDIGFLADRRYLGEIEKSGAGALLVSADLEPQLAGDERPRLVAPDGHAALARILELLFPLTEAEPEIHSTAVFGTGVRLGRGVLIGPYAVIESGAVVGDGVKIGAHVVIGTGARIGDDSVLHPHAVVYPGAELGERVILHAGASIGVDGFGYASRGGRPEKVPQVGRCVIENDVEIGANTTVDRGSIGTTRVGAHTKLDNLVQIAHNVALGPGVLLAAQVGIAGSSQVGAGAMFGGQSGVVGHLTVGPGAQIAAKTGVTRDVPAGEIVMGFPARPRAEFLRATAAGGKLAELVRRVAKLEEKLGGS